MRRSLTATLLLLALAVPRPSTAPPDAAPAGLATCGLDMLHPLDVEVRLAAPLAPQRWVRSTVRVQSHLDLTDVQIRIEPQARVELAGQNKLAIGEIAARSPVELGFDLRVPDTRDVLQVAVRVSARAEGALLERGAVLQLLPHGPHHPGDAGAPASGGHGVLEYRGAARRVP